MKHVTVNLRQLQGRYTGVQSYIYNLVKHLLVTNSDKTFTLVTYNYANGNQFIEELIGYPNATHINLNGLGGPVGEILFDHFQISRVLTPQTAYFNPVNITPFFKHAGVKYVIGVLDLCTYIVPETTTASLKTYYNLLLPGSIKRSDEIIAISQNTKADLCRLFKTNPAKVTVVHLGIDEEIVPTKGHHHKGSRYFLMMATSWRKNILNMLTAYQIFLEKNSDIKLKIVVNNPGFASEIKQKTTEMHIDKNTQIFDKYISKTKLASLFGGATSFIYCPVYEGFGLPVLEAMKCKSPVITSNSSSIPEIAKGYAILVDPYKPEKIAKAMREHATMTPQRRQKVISKGYLHSKQFTWTKSAIAVAKVLYE